MVHRKICLVVCALALAATSGSVAVGGVSAGSSPRVAAQGGKPDITGRTDGKHVLMHASYKGLVVRKQANRVDNTLSIELRYRRDAVGITLDGSGTVSTHRHGRTVTVDSAEAFEQVQQLLAGSAAVFAIRSLLAELETTSDLKAPEFTLLATAAFVASLVGDTGAPTRLADRFVAKHRGIVRPVMNGGCWSEYTRETTAAWSELQSCMNDANQDDSWFNGAYRRLACNGVWILRSESAWFEYLTCLSPLLSGGEV